MTITDSFLAHFKMKKYCLILSALAFFLFYCKDKKQKEDIKASVEVEVASVLSKDLEYELLEYIAKYPLGRSFGQIYWISFNKKDGDTTFFIVKSYLPALIKWGLNEFKGGFNQNSKYPILIFDYIKPLGASFYNASMLDKGIVAKYDSMLCDMTHVPVPHDSTIVEYIVKNGIIIPVE